MYPTAARVYVRIGSLLKVRGEQMWSAAHAIAEGVVTSSGRQRRATSGPNMPEVAPSVLAS